MLHGNLVGDKSDDNQVPADEKLTAFFELENWRLKLAETAVVFVRLDDGLGGIVDANHGIM